MERDFLGLSSKNVAMTLKGEFLDASKNSVSGSGMQWSFSNKVSAVPQLLSFKAAQDEKQRKTAVDPLVSSDTPNLTHRPYSAVVQKNVAPEKKAGNQYAMAVYPFQNSEALSVHRSQEVKIFPISYQPNNALPVAFNVPVLQSQLVSSGQTVVGSSVNLQPFGGVPIATSISVPFTSSVVGTTELRNASKPPGSLAQLTIFYAGSVCVYNDISPEKAQAIMLLAGSSGLPQTQNNMLSTGQVQASFPSERFQGLPPLGLSSPVSIAHCKGSNAGVGSSSNMELPAAVKPIQTSASHPNHSEPPKDASSVGSITPTFIPAAVPQARQASLARFLEKRKERINTCPYSVAKKTLDCSSTTLDLMA